MGKSMATNLSAFMHIFMGRCLEVVASSSNEHFPTSSNFNQWHNIEQLQIEAHHHTILSNKPLSTSSSASTNLHCIIIIFK
jgi:hypothetical protein